MLLWHVQMSGRERQTVIKGLVLCSSSYVVSRILYSSCSLRETLRHRQLGTRVPETSKSVPLFLYVCLGV